MVGSSEGLLASETHLPGWGGAVEAAVPHVPSPWAPGEMCASLVSVILVRHFLSVCWVLDAALDLEETGRRRLGCLQQPLRPFSPRE